MTDPMQTVILGHVIVNIPPDIRAVVTPFILLSYPGGSGGESVIPQILCNAVWREAHRAIATNKRMTRVEINPDTRLQILLSSEMGRITALLLTDTSPRLLIPVKRSVDSIKFHVMYACDLP